MSSQVSFDKVKVNNISSFAGTANGIWIAMNSHNINGKITIDKCETFYAKVIDPIMFFKDRPQPYPAANFYSIDSSSECSLTFLTPEQPLTKISTDYWTIIIVIIIIIVLIIGIIGFVLYRRFNISRTFKKNTVNSYIIFKNPSFSPS